MFFFALGLALGWWVRNTKAGTWVSKQFAASTE